MPIPYLSCMVLVAQTYALPPRVLPAIQAVEGGRPGLAMPNSNGSRDLGIMQVNTLWIRPIARYTGLPEPEVAQRLLERPCFNIAAAGWIMRQYLAEAGGDVVAAVGYYHSHTPMRAGAYCGKVVRAAVRLFSPAR